MSQCITCSKKADSREHYVPKWLSKNSGHESEEIIAGLARDGKMVSIKPRGTPLTAIQRCLCIGCNTKLGNKLEGPTQHILSPLIASNIKAHQAIAGLHTLTKTERHMLVLWTALRALQFELGYLRTPINAIRKKELVDAITNVMDGGTPKSPDDLFLEAGYASQDGWMWAITHQMKDRSGQAMNADGSFQWGMQVNRLILILASVPGAAMPDKRFGWGIAIHPNAPQRQIFYNGLEQMITHCCIIRLPVSEEH